MQKSVGEFDPAVVVMDPVSDLLRIGTGADVVGDADPPGRLPEGQGRDRAVHQPELRARARRRPTSRSRRSSTPGCWSRRWRATASTTACCTCSSRAGWRTPTRSASSCSPSQGIELADVYVGPQGVLTGSARQAQEAKERSDGTARLEDLEQRRVNLERRREAVEAQTAALWREFEDEADVVEPAAQPRLDRRRGPRRPARRAGPAARRRRRRAADAAGVAAIGERA